MAKLCLECSRKGKERRIPEWHQRSHALYHRRGLLTRQQFAKSMQRDIETLAGEDTKVLEVTNSDRDVERLIRDRVAKAGRRNGLSEKEARKIAAGIVKRTPTQ